MSKKELEEGLKFTPRFDVDGLIPCITTSASDGDVLMFAFMNREAVDQTIKTGEVHYWSRSRQCLWHKGATSGYTQRVVEMRTDCDQDCIWVKVEVNVPEGSDIHADTACHTGRKSCFYRQIETGPNASVETDMQFIDAEKLFDPDEVYKK